MVKEIIKIPFVEYDVTPKLKVDGREILFPTLRVSDATEKWDALVKACEATTCPDGRTLDKVVPMSQLWKWASIRKVSPMKEYHRRADKI